MKIPLFNRPSMIGLDVQPNCIHLIQLKKIKTEFLVELAIQCELPSEVFVEGKIKRWEILTDIVSEMVYAHSLNGVATTICLPENTVRRQSMLLPIGMTPTEIEAEIATRIHKELPGIKDVLSMDYVESASSTPGYSSISFTAARQTYLSEYVACLNASGLKVKIVEVDIDAIKRALCFRLPLAQASNVVIAALHLTGEQARILIFNQQENFAHQQWELSVNRDLPAQVQQRLQSFLVAHPNMLIHQLVVCGQHNANPSIGYPLFFTNPLTHMTLANHLDPQFMHSIAAEFLLACGLAMREVTAW